MKAVFTKSFEKDYKKLPPSVQRRTDKQLSLLMSNPRHPSLRTKKLQGTTDVWEISISREYRMTFTIVEDCLFLRRVGTHDVLKSP